MKIPKFNRRYQDYETLQKDFVEGNVTKDKDYFLEEYYEIEVDELVPFDIYLADFPNNSTGELKRTEAFVNAYKIIDEYYLNRLDRSVLLEGDFWYSINFLYFREFILEKYPSVKDSLSKFRNIVLKKFDWENYIYKLLLGAKYIDNHIKNDGNKEHYYRLIGNNLDVYNYIIKYEVFRTGPFLINVLDIIDEHGLSSLLKNKIKNRPDLGKDERYGRRVIYEFNKSYPVLLSPMMSKEELEPYFFKYLSYYYEEKEEKQDTKKSRLFLSKLFR